MPIQLNTTHPEENRVQAFLNALDENLEQVSFDWKSLKESNRIDDAIKLINTNKSLTITVIFVKDYWDANLIAKANFKQLSWGQNGSIMYVVESSDPDKVSEVLSVFAGRE